MRLDQFLVKTGDYKSRDRAKEAVLSGVCIVNGVIVKKPAYSVGDDDEVIVHGVDIPYVSRGGVKLEAALREFGIDVDGKVGLDVGVATGGFTDCLLQKGARLVYAVDVGKGQLVDELKKDDRVIFMPETDARNLDSRMFLEKIDLVVVDVSFISVLRILSALKQTFDSENLDFVFLIKPQFEVGEKYSRILRDKKKVERILEKVRVGFEEEGFRIMAEMESPITGKDGNREFLWHVRLI